MWLASEMAAFAHVCELKSFTAAARALGVPKVAVSRAIASLEKRLGTRLLTRTTRHVSLTPAGVLLRPHCARLLAEVEAVRSRFEGSVTGSQRLRVLTDPGYGRLLVTPLVPRFLENYHGIELSVAVAEEPPGDEDWDLMICRANLVSRDGVLETPLGRPPVLLCAAPAYLSREGRPRTPADLTKHALLTVSSASATLRLRRAGEEQELRPRPALQAIDPSLVHSSTAAGLGIGVLPEFLCRQGLAAGKLQRVLPEWSLADGLDLVALSPAGRSGSAMIRQFLEFVLANMVPVLSNAAAS
jgi:DNA-binding transcriptional LysR family regulator